MISRAVASIAATAAPEVLGRVVLVVGGSVVSVLLGRALRAFLSHICVTLCVRVHSLWDHNNV